MSTLKKELQKIVDEDLLNRGSQFICNNLSYKSAVEIETYKQIASDYAKEYWSGTISWWRYHYDEKDYVISEKYRFIKDLIKTL